MFDRLEHREHVSDRRMVAGIIVDVVVEDVAVRIDDDESALLPSITLECTLAMACPDRSNTTADRGDAKGGSEAPLEA